MKLITEEYKNRLKQLAGVNFSYFPINNFQQGKEFFDKFIQDNKYFKGFQLKKYYIKNDIEIWKLYKKYRKSDFFVILKHDFKRDDWFLKLEMIGRYSEKGEYKTKTTYGYEELKNILKNNLEKSHIWNIYGFNDNEYNAVNKETKVKLKILSEKINDLFKLDNPIFDELKRIAKIIQKYNNKIENEEMYKEILEMYENSEEALESTLSVIDKLNYYIQNKNNMIFKMNDFVKDNVKISTEKKEFFK